MAYACLPSPRSLAALRYSPQSISPSPPSLFSTPNSFYFSHFGFPKCRNLILRAQFSDSSDSNDASKHVPNSTPASGSMPTSRKEILLEYVNNIQPEFLDMFIKRAPQQVVGAMRQTVTNMLGSLPPQFFAVTVTTAAENLAQLMYSLMMTGYMFQNAQYRLELQQSLDQVALREIGDHEPGYTEGVQKKVSGEVIRWREDRGPEKIEAVHYIELLEAEIEDLKHQVVQKSEGRNILFEYLKSLEPQNLKELTSSAGEDVILAMNTFVKRLLLVSDSGQVKKKMTETSVAELEGLFFWLMVVGYSIRSIQVRVDLDTALGFSSSSAPLLPPPSS